MVEAYVEPGGQRGPNGENWHELILRVKSRYRGATVVETEDEEGVVTVAIVEPEEETPEDSFRMTLERTEVDAAKIKRISPKKHITAALQAGFSVVAHETETFTRGLPFKTGKRVGERRPDKTEHHLNVVGVDPAGNAAFLAVYLDWKFNSAKVWDVVGWPTISNYEQKPPDRMIKAIGERNAHAWADRINSQYPPEEFVDKMPRWVSLAGEFEDWLADFAEGMQHATIAPPVSDEQLLEGSTVDYG